MSLTKEGGFVTYKLEQTKTYVFYVVSQSTCLSVCFIATEPGTRVSSIGVFTVSFRAEQGHLLDWRSRLPREFVMKCIGKVDRRS
jgi:hypothetical protein